MRNVFFYRFGDLIIFKKIIIFGHIHVQIYIFLTKNPSHSSTNGGYRPPLALLGPHRNLRRAPPCRPFRPWKMTGVVEKNVYSERVPEWKNTRHQLCIKNKWIRIRRYIFCTVESKENNTLNFAHWAGFNIEQRNKNGSVNSPLQKKWEPWVQNSSYLHMDLVIASVGDSEICFF